MDLKRTITNVLLITLVLTGLILSVYYSYKDEEKKIPLYKIQIRGMGSRYATNVEYLPNGVVSFIDYETNRLTHVSSNWVVIEPKNK